MKITSTSTRLQQIMKERGLKQIDILNLAEPYCKKYNVKLGKSDLSQYLSGDVEPGQKKLAVLGMALNVSPTWLMGIEDSMQFEESLTPDIMGDNMYRNSVNFAQLSIDTNIPVEEIKNIYNGREKLPRPSVLIKIANALNCEPYDFLTFAGYVDDIDIKDSLYDSNIRYLLSDDEKKIMCEYITDYWNNKKGSIKYTYQKVYDTIFPNDKDTFSCEEVKNMVVNSNDGMMFNYGNISFDNAELVDINSDTVSIPVLGTIRAGMPIEAQEEIIDYVDIPREWTKGGKQFFGLKIKGNSMSPKYASGDTVVFESTEDFEYANNKDSCIMVNGFDATFKKFNINQSGVTLTPLNLENEDGYTTTFYDVDQVQNLPVRVIGIARRKISDIE